MTDEYRDNLVLAVYPSTRGFAYVLFEGPEAPFDWAVKAIRGGRKNAKTVLAVERIIERHHPAVLLIEDTGDEASRRSRRIRRLYRLLNHVALTHHTDVYRLGIGEVKRTFAALGARTKYEIAKVIAAQIPAFSHRLPRVRKPWMAEDSRQSLFDAAALGLTYFSSHGPNPEADT